LQIVDVIIIQNLKTMKKLIITSAIALSGLIYNTANAQIGIHLGFHFGPRPVVYEPARVVVAQSAEYCEPANYNGDEDYYYLPEVDAYYSIPNQCYYYNDGGQWVSAAYLPGAYSNFDWRTARRFEVRAPRPFMHDDYYRTRYNGVAFNGHGDRGYNRGYTDNHFNHDQFRRDDQRFDDNGRRNDSRQFNQNRNQHFDNGGNRNDQHMEQNRNFDRVGAEQHFAQNNSQRGGWSNGNNHRQGRF
jgi:hypothetical protein